MTDEMMDDITKELGDKINSLPSENEMIHTDHVCDLVFDLIPYFEQRLEVVPFDTVVSLPKFEDLHDQHKDHYFAKAEELLQGLYYCNRVWTAWNYGTMTREDFVEAAEDEDIHFEVAKALYDQRRRSNQQSQSDIDGIVMCTLFLGNYGFDPSRKPIQLEEPEAEFIKNRLDEWAKKQSTLAWAENQLLQLAEMMKHRDVIEQNDLRWFRLKLTEVAQKL